MKILKRDLSVLTVLLVLMSFEKFSMSLHKRIVKCCRKHGIDVAAKFDLQQQSFDASPSLRARFQPNFVSLRKIAMRLGLVEPL